MVHINIPNFDFNKVLFLGIGGGFDVFGAIPLADRLKGDHFLASYGDKKDFIVRKATTEDYPSYVLSEEYENVYVLGRNGVQLVKKGLQQILGLHPEIDTIIAIDGGVDSLMHGDEKNPGTILEDFIVMAAIDEISVKYKYLVCLGFGTEAEEGIEQTIVLKNISELSDHLIGTCSLTKNTIEFQNYKKLCEKAWKYGRVSHIQSQIIAAVEGCFGNIEIDRVDSRLYGQPLNKINISPIMSTYWFFDFKGVIEKNRVVNCLRPSSLFTDAMMLYRQYLDC